MRETNTRKTGVRNSEGRRGAKLGQHFLVGKWAAAALAAAASIQPDDTVVEIGPGKGALTGELLKHSHRIVAVEKDLALVEILREKFADEIKDGVLEVLEGDVRRFSKSDAALGAQAAGRESYKTYGERPAAQRNDEMRRFWKPPYVVAANIPYYITGEIIKQFLTTKHQPRTMALLIQKEVAERIIARDGKESILSLSVKVYGRPSIIAKVARGNFSPPPSVDSAILRIEHISKDFFTEAHITEEDFFTLLHAGFASKRKYLASNLGSAYGKDRVLTAFKQINISDKARAEDLPLEHWRALATLLA